MNRYVNISVCVTALALMLGQTGCKQDSLEVVEQKILASKELRYIDQICKEFPKPARFEQAKKGLSGNSETTIIFYQYISHMPFETVKAFYQDSANRGQYSLIREEYKEPLINLITFRRDDIRIVLEQRPPSGIVNVDCVKPSGSEPPTATYPPDWFAPVSDPNKPDWEILPQEARDGEVILSKRNELGILSNFAATPFELYSKRYASVEGFWQMMLYPEGTSDERTRDKRVTWKFTRATVAQMTAFEAKSAGTLAEENMKTLRIDWCTFDGKKFPYRSTPISGGLRGPGEHYKLILAAMRAKADQNPEVKRILLATGDLILKPDHHGEREPPPEWKYYEIWMQIRSEIQRSDK